MIISVHVPKTAGTSVLAFLEASAGDGVVRRDYRGGPAIERGVGWAGALVQAAVDRADRLAIARAGAGVALVHGHFRASKYAGFDAPLVAWVRDPVERVASHWAHFARHPEKNRHADAVRGGLGLVDFAARPGIRNLQSSYLDVPLDRFAFVGRTEHFARDLARMAERLGLPAREPEVVNRNPDRAGEGYAIPDEDRERIRALNAADEALVAAVEERFGP